MLPLLLVVRLGGFDERRHGPLYTELALAALEPDVLLYDFEAETRHGQDDRIFRHGQKVEQIGFRPLCDAVSVSITVTVQIQFGLFV